MIKYVLSSNLPSGRVNKIICGTDDEAILKFFAENNIEVLSITENTAVDFSVSSHADMAALHLGKNRIIVDKAQKALKSELEKIGFTVFETRKEIKGTYPEDIKLNFSLIGNSVIGNIRYADSMLIELLKDRNQISVRQGYSKCSTLVVSEKAIITDDEGIYREAIKNGFDALLISKGDIALKGHEYGFIGGASGKISESCVIFFGDITFHRDFEKISAFLLKHGCGYVCTDKAALRDIGGIIPLTED